MFHFSNLNGSIFEIALKCHIQLELSKFQSNQQNDYNTNNILVDTRNKNKPNWLCVHRSSMMCNWINLIFKQFAILIDSWNLSGPKFVHINAIFSFLLYIKLFSIFNIFPMNYSAIAHVDCAY